MTSPQGAHKLLANNKVVWVCDTSDRTTLAAIPVSEAGVVGTWFAMKDYRRVMALLILHTRADNVEQMHIYAASDSSGSDAAAIVSHAGTTACDAAGDGLCTGMEVTAEQLAQEGADAGVVYTHISIAVKTGNSSDRVTGVLIAEAKQPHLDLSVDYSA